VAAPTTCESAFEAGTGFLDDDWSVKNGRDRSLPLLVNETRTFWERAALRAPVSEPDVSCLAYMAVTRRTGIAAFDMVSLAFIFEKVSIHVLFI